MTGPERAYADRLLILGAAGEIVASEYQPAPIRLDDKTCYTPDFRVWGPGGAVRIVEVKGCRRTKKRRIARPFFKSRDSLIRWRWAAQLHPEWEFIITWLGDSGWEEERP